MVKHVHIALGVMLLIVGSANAQVQTGESIAENWCANCHSFDAGARRIANDAARPFAALAELPPDRVRGVLLAPHKRMRGIDLTRRQIDMVIEYIGGLPRGLGGQGQARQ